MRHIYSRVSTDKQQTESQTETLTTAYPDAKVWTEKASGKSLDRPVWQELASQLKDGDSVIVYDLSRLGRNTAELLTLADEWQEQGVNLVVHNLGGGVVDTGTATGRLMFTVLAAVGQMQKDIQNEKTQLGVDRAKAAGKMKGGRPHKTKEIEKAVALHLDKGLTKQDAAKAAGVGIASLYRALKAKTAS